MTTLERIADTFFPEQKKGDYTTYGRVTSVNPDGSYQVQLNASGTDTRCTKLCEASVGDSVLVVVQSNGKAAAIGRVGGEDFIPKSGGEIDGKLIRKSSNVDLTKNDNGLTTYWNPVAFQINDKNDLPMGYLQWYAHNTGYTYVALDARNRVNGSQVINQLVIRVDKDGTRKVSVTDPAAWRSAIGVTPTVLYNSSTGTTGTVTLSQTAANFDHMRIYYAIGSSSGTRHSVDVYSPNGKVVSLFGTYQTATNNNRYASTQATVSGTSISIAASYYFDRNYSSGNISGSTSNIIYIQRVEGWNA